MVTWTKLKSGEWGLRATEALVEGATTTVAKKDGSTSTAVVGKLVWQGNGAFLYGTGPKPAAEQKAPAARPAARRNWRPCGYPGCCPSYCDECDGEGAGGRYAY